jgi:hypothetical protein
MRIYNASTAAFVPAAFTVVMSVGAILYYDDPGCDCSSITLGKAAILDTSSKPYSGRSLKFKGGG